MMYTYIPVLGLSKWHSFSCTWLKKLGINLDFSHSTPVSSTFKFYSDSACLPCTLPPQWPKAPSYLGLLQQLPGWSPSFLLHSNLSHTHNPSKPCPSCYPFAPNLMVPHLIQSNSQNTKSIYRLSWFFPPPLLHLQSLCLPVWLPRLPQLSHTGLCWDLRWLPLFFPCLERCYLKYHMDTSFLIVRSLFKCQFGMVFDYSMWNTNTAPPL